EILLTNKSEKTSTPSIRIGGSIFSSEKTRSTESASVQNFLIYPKDVSEALHRSSIQTNSKATDCYIVPGKVEMIPEAIKDNNATLFIVANAMQLFAQQTPLVEFITRLREQAGYEKLIYTPCIGDPTSIALLAYMGVDLIDSFPAIMAARNETFLFTTGSFQRNQLHELPCTCPACISHATASEMGYEEILSHNYHALATEMKRVRNAIRTGSLRELVETRVRARPTLVAMLRILDLRYYPFLEQRTPITRKQALIATTKEALTRPEVRRFQGRVLQRYHKPRSTKVLLLLPCSAKKPYSFSKSHQLFREQLLGISNPSVVHELIITSPLGLVPRELELTYPASAYDIAVTGHWDEDEKKMIRTLLEQYLTKNTYDTVIMHLPTSLQEFTRDALKNPLSTCIDTPTSSESLEALADALKKTTRMYDPVRSQQRTLENIQALACYQFGEGLADQLLEGCTIKGKYPYQKIMDNNRQVGMVTQERGLISLTLDGAERLRDASNYWVEVH
ncbi:MAG TPA: archaeosine synthase subunit alpha, partial [Candidatus Thermoplasmatota archaeon]|nr:archaeosine synthase subunit alpha [Candidatus Thermoplasmatota archaeon]